MDLEGIMLSEVSRTEEYKYHVISLKCGLKNKKSNTHKTNSSQTQGANRGLPEGRAWGYG